LKIQKCSYLELELSYPSKLYLIISDDWFSLKYHDAYSLALSNRAFFMLIA
jgi:hypothetical protein